MVRRHPDIGEHCIGPELLDLADGLGAVADGAERRGPAGDGGRDGGGLLLGDVDVLSMRTESPLDVAAHNPQNLGGSCHGGEFVLDLGGHTINPPAVFVSKPLKYGPGGASAAANAGRRKMAGRQVSQSRLSTSAQRHIRSVTSKASPTIVSRTAAATANTLSRSPTFVIGRAPDPEKVRSMSTS